jgi:glutathione reductase (NADPH)
MPARCDVLVLGTGVAASTIAHRCNAAGRKVAVVDSRPYGGTCALRGCDPKKVLTGVADLAHTIGRMQGNGLRCHGVDLDWPGLMQFKRSFTQPVPKHREEAFREAGIETLHGRARFVKPHIVEVDGQRIEAERIAIATGAKPRPLQLPGAEALTTSAAFLDLDELPDDIAFVGGGYVSLELASLAQIAGAQTRVFHRGDRLLEPFDADLVAELGAALRERGMRVHRSSPVREIEVTEDSYRVYTDGEQPALEHDLVVHGAGRVPEIGDLALDEVGVEHGSAGVQVDEHLRSVSQEHVYAAGDAAASEGWPLTPVAGLEGRVVADNILAGEPEREPDYRGTASVVFTIPPLARVGLRVAAARVAADELRVVHEGMREWFSYARLEHAPAASKVLVDEADDRILGAHVLGSRAEETINVFAMAIREGITPGQLSEVPFAYPSHGSDVSSMV